jgi:hypothetical protein
LFLAGLEPWLSGVQLFISIVILLRWRGAFNGGSDFLGLHLVSILFLARLFPASSRVAMGGLWYISLQVVWSYFIAGWVKVKNSEWRSGAALAGFLKTSIYTDSKTDNYTDNCNDNSTVNGWLTRATHSVGLMQSLTWCFLVFELVFPLSLFGGNYSLILMTIGACFHFSNFILFGLNRFFWIWISAYPALYFCGKFHLLLGSSH